MRVKDVMTTPAQTCYVDTDLGTVAGMMREHNSGFIPVVSGARRVVGLVTDRDICIVAANRRLAPVHISAAQAMSETVHACFPDDAVSIALAAMRQFKVRRLPVVDLSGGIKGVISLNDILRAAGTRRDVPADEVLATLADICEPSMMGDVTK
jgi:CBS domain-containing protein